MSRSTGVARQIWCLALSRSISAAKTTLWSESGRILAVSGCKFSYGLLKPIYNSFKIIIIIIIIIVIIITITIIIVIIIIITTITMMMTINNKRTR